MIIKKVVLNLKRYQSFIILFLLIFVSYSNSLNNSWHFDDHNNILENQNIQLETINFNTIIKSLYHWDNTYIYRPVTNLSFALNWFIGRDIVTGYHLINILIHIFTAYFLYLVITKLLQAKRFESAYYRNFKLIAILSTTLWAVDPIHVQAITLIVQRATLLSALFSIISIYTYILGREKKILHQSILYFSICFFSLLLAIAAKENAILLPGSLILVEVFFLRQTPFHFIFNNKHLWITAAVILSVIIYFVISSIIPGKISINMFVYDGRNFTLFERLLTESRVLIFYLSQIAYPLSNRLSLEHDISLSTSLFHPWTTFPAIILIFTAVFFSLYKYKKYPLFSFAILFYFYNHIVESTIMPLEIIFEHRNYLPSFFLFLPIVAFLTNSYERNKNLKYFIIFSLISLVIVFSIGCYIRNLAWKTEKTLLIDAITKAPNQARSYHNLAYYLLNHDKDVDEALNLFNIALTKESPSKHGPKYQSLIQISNIYINYKQDFPSAIPIIREALAEQPDALTPRKILAISLIAVGQLDEALQHIELLLLKRGPDYKLRDNEQISRQYLLNLKTLVLLKQNLYSRALTSAKEAEILEPGDPLALANLGLTLSKIGKHEEANEYLSKLSTVQKKPDLITFLLLLENSLRAKDFEKANEVATHIVLTFPVKDIFSTLAQLDKPSTLQPLDSKILQPCLLQKLSELGSSMNISNFSLSKPLSKFSK